MCALVDDVLDLCAPDEVFVANLHYVASHAVQFICIISIMVSTKSLTFKRIFVLESPGRMIIICTTECVAHLEQELAMRTLTIP